jgi:hypothetical protein
MRARGIAVAALAAAALAAGCDWREFDSLQGTTPVLAVEPPSGYPSSTDFATLLTPTRPPVDGSAAARFVTTAAYQTAVTVVTVSAGGGASTSAVNSAVLDQLHGQPITAIADIPGTDQALLGAPQPGGGSVLLLDFSVLPAAVAPFNGITPLDAAEPLLGVGLAAGKLTGAASPDLVVLSASALHVYVGGATEVSATSTAACPIALYSGVTAFDRIQRAAVIGKLTGTSAVVAVGTPGAGAPGNVSFFAYDGTNRALTCLFALTPPAAAGDPDFGRSLATGDFDGDGTEDLLVGAPPARAYLYKGPIATGAQPVTLTDPAGDNFFGASAAAMDLDGLPGDEALIADPSATVNGQPGAGHVLALHGPALATQTAVLTDHSASANNAYGSAVAALPFCAAPPCTTPVMLPLVGAANKAFVYFTLTGTDPRAR